jgi:hypothetical protein
MIPSPFPIVTPSDRDMRRMLTHSGALHAFWQPALSRRTVR